MEAYQLSLKEIIRENNLHPYNVVWREAIKQWQELGYWVVRNVKGQLVIRGDHGKEIRVHDYAFGTKVYLHESDKTIENFAIGTPHEKIIDFVNEHLPLVTEQTRKDEQEFAASQPRGEFVWKERARPIGVSLVTQRMRNHDMTMEQAVVSVLTNRNRGVCYGYEDISIKTLTGFVSDCWDEYNKRPFRKIKSQDGEIERIYAALTGQEIEAKEVPVMKSEQLDLFSFDWDQVAG